jgi:hypothetical protein
VARLAVRTRSRENSDEEFPAVDFHAVLKEVDHPTQQPIGEQVLIKVKAAGVCHTDLHIWEGGYELGHGRKPLSLKDRSLVATLNDPFALTSGFGGAKQPHGDKPVYEEDLQSWSAAFVMAMINPRNVHRSNILMGFPYGRDFVYDEMVLTGQTASRLFFQRKRSYAGVTSIFEVNWEERRDSSQKKDHGATTIGHWRFREPEASAAIRK